MDMAFPVHDRKAIEELEAIRANLLRLEYLTVHLCEELEAIKHILKPHHAFHFSPIKEISPMVPLAAGQTATFSTTPIPSTVVLVPANIVWSSSDTTNAPVSPNPTDPTGLSTLVVFPSTTPGDLTFTLTVTYTNADGTVVTQPNDFTTVAPPPVDVTGFTPITQVN